MQEFSNKRIAQNTIYLYLRMVVIMLVTLYTSRVVLNTLGINDFGIYNIIGGVIVLFSFLNNAMSNATQRFLSYEIGKNDTVQLNRVFVTSLNCHVIIAIIILFLSETIGLWFVNTQLNIPNDRVSAANWVYQLSILTFLVTILRVPYNAIIISFEKMGFYAYISIIESILKLVIVYLLLISTIDKLSLYSFLVLLVSIIVTYIYYLYCKRTFKASKYHFFWEKALFLKLMNFSGWSMFGAGSTLIAQQGGNILINVFGNVAANAAFGIANQVSNAIYGFVSNFQIAFNPQIVKLYANKQYDSLFLLMKRSSKMSYYLLFVIIVPLLMNLQYILVLWLNKVPNYTSLFCTYMVLFLLIDSVQAPLWMAIYATGNIKTYQIFSSFITLVNIPLSWILLIMGFPLIIVLIIRVALNIICSIVRTIYISYQIKFPGLQYVKSVILNILFVSVISILLCNLYKLKFSQSIISFHTFVIQTFVYFFITIFFVFCFGLNKNEKKYIINFITHGTHN